MAPSERWNGERGVVKKKDKKKLLPLFSDGDKRKVVAPDIQVARGQGDVLPSLFSTSGGHDSADD